MKTATLFLLVTLAACPLLAGSPDQTLLGAALDYVPTVVTGTISAETSGFALKDYAIDNETAGGDAGYLRWWLPQWHGNAIADELNAAYFENGKHSARLKSDESREVPVLALDEFRGGAGSYDWKRLRAAHPDVRAVVVMSLPAMESQGSYAVVHYDVLTEEGRAFSNFEVFEREGNGTWRYTHGVSGDLVVPKDERGLPGTRATSAE